MEGTSLKEQNKKDASLKEQDKKDASLKEQDKKDTSLKEQDKKDTSLKDELTNLKDEYSSFKVGFEYITSRIEIVSVNNFVLLQEKGMKEKQTLIDQIEKLKQSEREYELKIQELMERNTQLKVRYPSYCNTSHTSADLTWLNVLTLPTHNNTSYPSVYTS